jgi:hypothetical protein
MTTTNNSLQAVVHETYDNLLDLENFVDEVKTTDLEYADQVHIPSCFTQACDNMELALELLNSPNNDDTIKTLLDSVIDTINFINDCKFQSSLT